jgi:hypothetical protein
MWNTKTVIVLAFSLSVALNSANSQTLVNGQIDKASDATNNNNKLEFATNNNISLGISHNDTRIMENTSGMIDEALGALKDSFSSLFGK